ncbi:MAG: hypothetical protein U0871_25100 [Gemmataceae bacterium]
MSQATGSAPTADSYHSHWLVLSQAETVEPLIAPAEGSDQITHDDRV